MFGLPFGVFMLSEGPWIRFFGGFVRSIRAPWSESLSLNNEVNNCPFVSFVPLQIIMRALFRLIICTFWYDISFKC